MNLPSPLLPDPFFSLLSGMFSHLFPGVFSNFSWQRVLSAALHSPLAEKLGTALLHFVWQGALIGCLTAVLLALLRNARPQTRYALACTSLLLCLAMPALHLLLPAGASESLVTLPVQAGNTPLPDTRSVAKGMTGGITTGITSGITIGSDHAWRSLTPWMVALWLIGLLLFGLRLLAGLLWLRRLHQSGASATSQPGQLQPILARWQHKLDHLAQGFGLPRAVKLVLVNGLDSPVASGWWRPVVVVPAALLSGLPPAYLEALLAHELAHIKRLDPLVNLLQNIIETILFYHPAVWWISKQIRQEREQIADDLAATRLGDTRRLALALQQLDQFQSSINQFAPAANGGMLMTRIKRLIRPETRNLNWKVSLPLAGLALVCSALYANVQADPAKAASSVPAMPAVPAVPAVPAAPAVPATQAGSNSATPATPPAPPAVPAPISRRGKVAPPAPPAPLTPPAPPAPPAPITDEALLSQSQIDTIKQIEARAEQIGASMAAIGAKQHEIGVEMGKIGRELAKPQSEAERAILQQKMARLQARMTPLQKEMDQANQTLQAEVRQLQDSLGPLSEESRALLRTLERDPSLPREQAREMARQAREQARETAKLAREQARQQREAARAAREAARAAREADEKPATSEAAKPL